MKNNMKELAVHSVLPTKRTLSSRVGHFHNFPVGTDQKNQLIQTYRACSSPRPHARKGQEPAPHCLAWGIKRPLRLGLHVSSASRWRAALRC